MSDIVSARGYTRVVMVMNLSRFVQEIDKGTFHALRGAPELRQAMRRQWYPALNRSEWFTPVDIGGAQGKGAGEMSVDDVGFATGVFRQYLLETATAPTYRFNKKAYSFPSSLRHNFQFKHIFWPIWKHWDIFVRPSSFGLLVIRLERHYPKATPLELIAADVIRLQSPFDISSALRWLERLQKMLADNRVRLEEKERSVQELLQWLTGGQKETGELEYSPAQWQLAMEVSRAFVQTIGYTIQVNGQPVHFHDPPPSLSHPLHDSYVIYHIDTLLASPHILPSYQKKDKQIPSPGARYVVPAHIEDISTSEVIRQKLLNLLEGALLRDPAGEEKGTGTPPGSGRFFPRLRTSLLEEFGRRNLASWHDEICIMNSHAALILPSAEARRCDLFLSTMPASATSSSRVPYLRYWEAIERLIEFVAEVRVLAQLIEHASSRLLQHGVTVLHKKRRGLVLRKTAALLREFDQIIAQTANLSRLLAIAQTLNNPAAWSRAEFAINKASHLLTSCSVPQSLQHAAENISNLNALVEHLDELFLADTSTQREQLNFRSSLAITALSLVLTVLILPSFWADLRQLDISQHPGAFLAGYLSLINEIGSWMAVILVLLSATLFIVSVILLFNSWHKSHKGNPMIRKEAKQ